MTILTPKAPLPIGPYSQAICEGELIFCSGQVALDPESGAMKNSSIEEETKQVLTNVSEVVKAGGGNLSSVIKTTIFLTDMNDFAKVNEIYGAAFGDAKPARSTIAVSTLPKGARIEIECIAKVI
jgi:2-iminobutanoate/2-iminopropanoate deaminase